MATYTSKAGVSFETRQHYENSLWYVHEKSSFVGEGPFQTQAEADKRAESLAAVDLSAPIPVAPLPSGAVGVLWVWWFDRAGQSREIVPSRKTVGEIYRSSWTDSGRNLVASASECQPL